MTVSSDTYFVYNTPLGRLTIGSNGAAITRLVYGPATLVGENRPTALTNQAATQLQEYLAGKRRQFDLPLAPAGTEFQKLVWHELERIPYGETRTYGQIAQAIGRPTATRAVGGANNKNPIPIIVPCHRVIGANGNLVGYAAGVHIKRFLLDLEANHQE